ncbi:acyl-CoA dehydrogenase/oxidase [Mycena latifolia]|nr:acyl-CoA dehydrogenase/oxidase [Mycena latifolia]
MAAVQLTTEQQVFGSGLATAKVFSVEEVQKHSSPSDLWVIIDEVVFDLTRFRAMHPGGESVLLDAGIAGTDATDAFFGLHKSEILTKYKRLAIGRVAGKQSKVLLSTPGSLSEVPFAEPTFLSKGYHSPYYTDEHRALQAYLRKFMDEKVIPEALAHEKTDERPTLDLVQLCGKEGVYINQMRLGPGKHLHGLTLPGGMKGEYFDYFAELILNQELGRAAKETKGYAAHLFLTIKQGGMIIGLPPVKNFGSKALQDAILPDVLAGKKFICLAITEAFAGSDVARLRCTAEKTPDGKFYLVNGTKKWITNGTFADYFSTGVRTGDNELSMLLIPRGPGVSTKVIKTSYSSAAGTAYVTFENVKVPVENLLGKEGKGLQVILSNFNHERWGMCCTASRMMRSIAEDSFKWANQRIIFEKRLIDQPVVRAKFARMFSHCESTQAWLESITYQMTKMTYDETSDLLAGQIALLKAYITRTAGEIAADAVQILGGRGLTKGAMGGSIEAFQRTIAFDAVLGGAEDVLADLGVRRAMRKMVRAVL